MDANLSCVPLLVYAAVLTFFFPLPKLFFRFSWRSEDERVICEVAQQWLGTPDHRSFWSLVALLLFCFIFVGCLVLVFGTGVDSFTQTCSLLILSF